MDIDMIWYNILVFLWDRGYDIISQWWLWYEIWYDILEFGIFPTTGVEQSSFYINSFLFIHKTLSHTRAVRNCSFRFDTNISGKQAFISKPISKSIMWKLYFETNIENEIALWAISISITISISKSPIFGWYFETISISKPIFYYISPPKGWL